MKWLANWRDNLKRAMILGSALLLAGTSVGVQALSPWNQMQWAEYEIYWFDPDEDLSVIGSRSCTTTTMLPGDSVAERLWNLFATKSQFSDAQIAGILGNAQQESGMNPFAQSASGTFNGIFQWGHGRWDALLGKLRAEGLGHLFDGSNRRNFDNVSEADLNRVLEIQVDHALSEVRGSRNWSSWTEAMLASTTPEEAAEVFLVLFEGAIATNDGHRTAENRIMYFQDFLGTYWQETYKRRDFARDYYDRFSGHEGGMTINTAPIDQTNAVFVGDSRMARMCNDVNLSNCVTNANGDVNWLRNTAAREAAAIEMPDGAPIVVMMGINDLNNASSYVAAYRELANGPWAGRRVVVLAVPPVSDAAGTVTNAQIMAFNETVANGLSGGGVTFCGATNSGVAYSGLDGITFDPTGSEAIFRAIQSSCGGVESTNAQCGELTSGGMTLEQAWAFVNFYNHGSDTEIMPYLSGAGMSCVGGPRSNCVSFSTYFARRFTTVGQYGRTGGNGDAFAGNLYTFHSDPSDPSNTWAGESGGAPRPYSIFSRNYQGGGGTQCGGRSCGHTGVVLGVFEDQNLVITGEASCGGWGEGALSRAGVGQEARFHAIVLTYTIEEFMNWYQLFVVYPQLTEEL